MFWKACLISLLVGALSTAAFAEQLLPVSPDVIQPQAEAALIIITTLITAYFAYAMFNEQSVNLDDGPMLPRYMTQPRQSIAAGITYVTMCIILYELGVYFFNDLLPLEELLPLGGITEAVRKFLEENGPTFTSRVILEAALFYALFQVNREWNPLFVLRRLVWSWVSVPQLANVIMNVARHALAVPDHARAEVVRHPDCSTVDIRVCPETSC